MITATAATWLCEAIRAWSCGLPPPALPSGDEGSTARDAVLECGLGPLFYAWGFPDPEGRFRAAYMENLARSERRFHAGLALCGEIEHAGLPCIPMRGPFVGHRYYRDMAVRGFTDLDLLVPHSSAGEALRLARRAGYELRQPGLPSAYYRAVHLHFPLRRRQDGLFCDLHWAVDHPFQRQAIPYEEIFAASDIAEFGAVRWRRMRPEDEILLACAHAWKELQPHSTANSDLLSTALLRRQLFPLLDVALMLSALPPAGSAGHLSALAQRWGLGRTAACVMDAARPLTGRHSPVWMAVADSARWQPPAETAAPTWVEQAGCFRLRRIRDALPYVLAPPGTADGVRSAWPRRAARAARAALHLVSAGLVAAACLLIFRLRVPRGGVTL